MVGFILMEGFADLAVTIRYKIEGELYILSGVDIEEGASALRQVLSYGSKASKRQVCLLKSAGSLMPDHVLN